ncbi:MAG: hypothetical protein B7Y47_16905 [Sphingomonas sp. 28-63-12]|nr:MAG: hypothetical protein B7Y47_16905 [Sphingomonas sp. 28-63-12]
MLGVAMISLTSCLTAARNGARPVGNATLQIEVTGVRNSKGVVHVDICREAEFLKDCPVQGSAPAVAGKTIVTVSNLLPGSYAVQAFHDENRNGKVDRALFGIPKEGVGFSNDAPIRLGPPKWSDAVFSLSDDKVISFKLRYFLGSGAKN